MQKRYLNTLILLATISLDAKPPQPLNKSKEIVQEYYESGKFDQEVTKVVKKFWKKLKKIAVTAKSVIVCDIDDTFMSCYEANKKWGFGYLMAIDTEWKWAQAANQPAIKPMKDLYDKLVKKGFKIIFLSNRPHHLFEATTKNLCKLGYTTYERLIIRPINDTITSGQKFKKKVRERLVKQGYNIVACIGDQESDITGKHSGITMKVPNYIYQV